MSVSYSGDLRRRVIAAYVANEGSQNQLAQRFKMSLSFVRNLLRRYQDCGEIETKQRGGYQTFYGTKPCGYIPPVTSRNEPVVHEASSDNNHKIAWATSITCPPRFIGINALTRSIRFGSPPLAWISV